jgi:hypothetical protein
MASPELARRYLPSPEMWMLQVRQKWRYRICYRQQCRFEIRYRPQYRCELGAGLSTPVAGDNWKVVGPVHNLVADFPPR